MKQNRKREILVFVGVLSVSLMALLLINSNKPFAILGSDGQAKQVTNAFWQQQAAQATRNPDESVTLSPDTSLSAELQLTNTNQASDSKTATDLPSGTQSTSVKTSGTASASSGTANILPLSATSTPVNKTTQTTQPGTPTPTRQPTNLILPSPSFTPLPTTQTGWEGEWTAYLAQPDGSYRSGKLTVTIAGEAVSGVFVSNGITMNLEGLFQTDRLFVSGDYAGATGNGWFKWMIQENTYLIGNIDNDWSFCAAREGSPQPDPCGYFDPR